MQSLWALLRPQPGGKSQAHATMTLLGKLGGRNRRWLQQPVPLEYKKDPEHGLRLGERGRAGGAGHSLSHVAVLLSCFLYVNRDYYTFLSTNRT
jgi:hypothetical protein